VGGNDSFMVIFRKETKKKCKQEHTLHFGTKSRSLWEKNPQFFLLLVLSPDAGEGQPELWGPQAAPPCRKREVRGLQEAGVGEASKDPSTKATREKGIFILWEIEAHPLGEEELVEHRRFLS
jgi:hypothetical protein